MDRLSGASDAELVSRCLQRDADAWDALIRRYQRLIASITVTVRECWNLRQKTGRMVPLENSLAAIGQASFNQPVSAEGEMLILERQHILRREIGRASCRERV